MVPDLRGFGESDKHVADPAEEYSAAAQARSVAGLIEELGLEPAIVAGYDVGSRAFVASINWYRAGSGGVAMSIAETTPAPEDRIAQPTSVLWPEHDPLFPREWGDRLDEFFADFTLTDMPGTGHFSPLEAPEAFASAISASTTA